MYKIVSIKEHELKKFKGKIVSVIDKQTIKIPSYDSAGLPEPDYMCSSEWILTCLVEEEDEPSPYLKEIKEMLENLKNRKYTYEEVKEYLADD